METTLLVPIVGAICTVIVFVIKRAIEIRARRPAAAAALLTKIDAAIPFDYQRSVNKNPVLVLADIAIFKENLWWWQKRRLQNLWEEYEPWQYNYVEKRVQLLTKIKSYVRKYT